MSQLVAIIDEYKDTHGAPSDSSIARAIGVAPQTISSWRKRGIREAPAVDAIKKLAALVGLPYEEYVLQAVLVDTGYREAMPERPGSDDQEQTG
jgi:transcriptional regulator with XRE-family HTH domain